MPPVLGPVSPSPIRLKSCERPSGTTCPPATSANAAHLRPLEQLLHHHGLAGIAEGAALEAVTDRLLGGRAVRSPP